jgi:hypothetical protein
MNNIYRSYSYPVFYIDMSWIVDYRQNLSRVVWCCMNKREKNSTLLHDQRVSATIKYVQVKQCFDTRFVFVAKQ